MKIKMLVMSFLGVCLVPGIAPRAFAANEEIKLNSNDGTTKLVLQNNVGAAVFSADSDGNIVANGTAAVVGSQFSVGGSTFVVQSGNVGIRTASPGAKLEVAGQVKITGGAPGANKVLTSDADGLGTWQVAPSTFSIGDSYGGGIIFWLDASGQHGLIAAAADQSSGIQWNNSGLATGATLDAVYAGRANAAMIISTPGTGGYAAKLCADHTVTVSNEYYYDWYLPSRYELSLLYAQKGVVGGFTAGEYWSATESSTTLAWYVRFSTGGDNSNNKTIAKYVRCVRGGP